MLELILLKVGSIGDTSEIFHSQLPLFYNRTMQLFRLTSQSFLAICTSFFLQHCLRRMFIEVCVRVVSELLLDECKIDVPLNYGFPWECRRIVCGRRPVLGLRHDGTFNANRDQTIVGATFVRGSCSCSAAQLKFIYYKMLPVLWSMFTVKADCLLIVLR